MGKTLDATRFSMLAVLGVRWIVRPVILKRCALICGEVPGGFGWALLLACKDTGGVYSTGHCGGEQHPHQLDIRVQCTGTQLHPGPGALAYCYEIQGLVLVSEPTQHRLTTNGFCSSAWCATIAAIVSAGTYPGSFCFGSQRAFILIMAPRS
jgi:hypothetical protein